MALAATLLLSWVVRLGRTGFVVARRIGLTLASLRLGWGVASVCVSVLIQFRERVLQLLTLFGSQVVGVGAGVALVTRGRVGTLARRIGTT